MNSLNGCMIPLIKWTQSSWLTKPNQDRSPVMFCGTRKYLMAGSMFMEEVIRNGVMLRPAKVTVLLQN